MLKLQTPEAQYKQYPNNPIVRKMQKTIRNSNKIFTPCWLPSHIGIHGNRSADKLTVQVTPHALSTPFEQTRTISKLTSRKHKIWNEKWIALQSNKLSENTDIIYMIPNTVCKNRQCEKMSSKMVDKT